MFPQIFQEKLSKTYVAHPKHILAFDALALGLIINQFTIVSEAINMMKGQCRKMLQQWAHCTIWIKISSLFIDASYFSTLLYQIQQAEWIRKVSEWKVLSFYTNWWGGEMESSILKQSRHFFSDWDTLLDGTQDGDLSKDILYEKQSCSIQNWKELVFDRVAI